MVNSLINELWTLFLVNLEFVKFVVVNGHQSHQRASGPTLVFSKSAVVNYYQSDECPLSWCCIKSVSPEAFQRLSHHVLQSVLSLIAAGRAEKERIYYVCLTDDIQ